MRILSDNGTPRGLAKVLSGHIIEEARSCGWDTLRNGELLDAAEAAGFDVFVTTDRILLHYYRFCRHAVAQKRLQTGAEIDWFEPI